jgi:predicted RNase H-like nuclease (RuvC/YqgF family)
MKIKKIAAQGNNTFKTTENPAWVNNLDSNLMRPRDATSLQEEITELRHHINNLDEEKKNLKANAEKYERRAKYTLEKFREIKAKEMQLIQLGE